MKESFEIPDVMDLTEVRDGHRVTYQGMSADGTVLSVTTDDAVTVDQMTVSKYRSAKVRVIIDIDHDDVEYKGVKP